MKFFWCLNPDCPAHIPGNGRENHVLECVVVFTPLDEDGNPVKELGGVRAQFEGYSCGLCQGKVEEVTAEKVISAEIIKVTPQFIVGRFRNQLRGEMVFHFALNVETGQVQFKEQDILFSPMEIEYLRRFCRDEYYEKGIVVELTDCYYEGGQKVYQGVIKNYLDGGKTWFEATKEKILDYDGPRELDPLEKKKLLETIRRSPY